MNEKTTSTAPTAKAQLEPNCFNFITAECADLSIKTDILQQDGARLKSNCQKKRRADGSLKNEEVWTMGELKPVLQSQCMGQKASEVQLRMDVDNLRRRIAVLEELKTVHAMRKTFPARHLSRKDKSCGNDMPLAKEKDKKAEMMGWKRVREDTLR